MEQIFELKEKKGITKPYELFTSIKKINIDYAQENLIVFYFNTKNILIKSEILFKGGLNSCTIDPKTLFRHALKLNANSLIIAHNHPSDNLEPSNEDKEVFKELKKCGEILQLKVLDSIIFNKKTYYSLC